MYTFFQTHFIFLARGQQVFHDPLMTQFAAFLCKISLYYLENHGHTMYTYLVSLCLDIYKHMYSMQNQITILLFMPQMFSFVIEFLDASKIHQRALSIAQISSICSDFFPLQQHFKSRNISFMQNINFLLTCLFTASI